MKLKTFPSSGELPNERTAGTIEILLEWSYGWTTLNSERSPDEISNGFLSRLWIWLFCRYTWVNAYGLNVLKDLENIDRQASGNEKVMKVKIYIL